MKALNRASRALADLKGKNVWQFLRYNWLSNRIFKSYDDIVAHCSEAWNELIEQPWRIRPIGRRESANGF